VNPGGGSASRRDAFVVPIAREEVFASPPGGGGDVRLSFRKWVRRCRDVTSREKFGLKLWERPGLVLAGVFGHRADEVCSLA